MKKITCNVYSDPGHAWAKVPKKVLKFLEISGEISSYSYERGDFAYLEEDCDLSIFVNACKNKGVVYKFREFYSDKSSKIRSYNSYKRV